MLYDIIDIFQGMKRQRLCHEVGLSYAAQMEEGSPALNVFDAVPTGGWTSGEGLCFT